MERTRQNKTPDAILTSDWHLRETVPVCRTDDFWTAQWKKVAFVKELQFQYNCPVLHAGDLFHHWKPSPFLLTNTMEFIPEQFYTIYGQHDLPQHSFENREKSGIHVLSIANALKVIGGTHWGQVPQLDDAYRFDLFQGKIHEGLDHTQRICLVWHRMVWQGHRLWPGQTDPSARAILKKYPEYDLIVTGDNHKPFVEKYENRLLINPGSLTRQGADQISHTPRVYLYYAADNTVRPVFLPVQEGAEVISRDHIERTEERDQRISAFISRLEGEWEAGLSFEQNLEEFFKNNRIHQNIKDVIYKAIEE